jgi:hypothetical protein
MIISKAYATRLIRQGKAIERGRTTTASTWAERAYGSTYVIVDRLDIGRVDHYKDK